MKNDLGNTPASQKQMDALCAAHDNSELSRAEKSRKIAESLGGFGLIPCPDGPSGCESYLCRNSKHPGKPVPDFYTSEEANALVTDKLLSLRFALEVWPQACDPRIIVIFRKVIGVGAGTEYGRGHLCADRKTAICEAYLKWLENTSE